MADSATPRTADLPVDPACVAVAYSGGRDSTALLYATAVAAAALAAQGLHLRVFGLHVHHGLSCHADAWLAHCEQQCRDWRAQGLPVELAHRRLSGSPAAGESVEAWARSGRYAALAEMAKVARASLLLLAHHRRDQAETWLLQALRGAGVAGLAGMPREQSREGLVWARPWLDRPREQIEAYVAGRGLSHIEDDSNTDTRYARNRLRLRLWPALEREFPQAEACLAQSAAWSQQALSLADEIAAEDLQSWQVEGSALPQQALAALSPARASNLLRAWLQAGLGHPAPASLVQRLMAECGASDAAQWPLGDAAVLRLYRGQLRIQPARPPLAPPPELQMDLSVPGSHACDAWGGSWQVRAVEQGGVAPELLRQLTLRPRGGGEQFQSHARGLPRSLKKAWQSAGVDVLHRQGPLLFSQGRLLWVPGLGFDARCLAPLGAMQLQLDWLPATPSSSASA